jgi:hypothetical protein
MTWRPPSNASSEGLMTFWEFVGDIVAFIVLCVAFWMAFFH